MMDEATLLKAFGFSVDEICALMTRADATAFDAKAKLSRLVTLRRTGDAGAHIANQLWECSGVLSKVGVYHAIGLSRDLVEKRQNTPGWEELLSRIFRDPVAVRNRTVWLLYQACLEAQRDFALDVCPARSHETLLTGRLVGQLSAACKHWRATAASFLERVDNTLELSFLDLSVAGGEQETGGDFALILDIEEAPPFGEDAEPEVITLTGGPRGDIVIPLLYQAKRYTGERANVSQKHYVRGFQFNQLRKTQCASSYIFYENGKTQIETPALPMVKPASVCKPVEFSPYTEVFEQSVDLATHVLRAINGFEDIPAAPSREDALNMILSSTSPDRLSRVAILCNTLGLASKYEEALGRLRAEPSDEPNPDAPRFDL